MRKLLPFLLAAFSALGADVLTPGLFYRTDTRVVGATNLYFVNQHITNSTINGVSSAAIATNSAANKLDITNGTAVNLTGVLTGVRLDGTTLYGGDGSNNLTANTMFALGLRGVNGETVSVYPTAHTTKNIASLVGLNTGLVTTNATVEVRGYYEPGDGGGGTFYYAPFEATNSGTVFQSGSGSFVWKRLLEGPAIDIRWFGARNNGFQTNEVYDSTAAIEAAVDYANATGSAVFIPEGEWISSGGHELDGIRMYGIKELNRFGVGGPSPFNTNATSVLRHKIGATNHMVRLLRGAQTDTFSMLGRRWYNRRNEYTITASSSSTITVATNGLPADPANPAILPYYGVGLLYTAEGVNAGTMVFTDINQTTGVLTFSSTFDYFCTATNGLIPAGWKVSISPTANLYNPRTDAYTTDFIDPTQAGWNAIQVDGDHCRIYDMTLYGFHVGVSIGNVYCTRVENLTSQGMALANIAKSNPFYGFDSYISGLSLQCSYTEDLYNPQASGAPLEYIGSLLVGTDIMDVAARYTPFGIMFPSNADQFNGRTVIDLPITGVWFGSPNTLTFDDLLSDSALHFGVFGEYGNSAQTSFIINNAKLRSPAEASPSVPPYQLARPTKWTNPTAMWVNNPSATRFNIGVLDIPDLGLGSGQRFTSGLYFAPGGTGTRSVGTLASTQGATNLLNGSSDGVTFGIGHNGSFDVTLDDLTATNSVTAATVTATGSATVGTAANGLSLTVNGGTSGTGMLRLVRDGVGTNSIGVGTRALTFRETTQNRTFAQFDTDGSTLNRLTFGGSATTTPRDAYIVGENASGTDQAGKILYVRPGAGTGNSTSGGSITFQTPDATSSGSTLQSHTSKFTIQRDGDIAIGDAAQIEFGTRAALSSPSTGVLSVSGVKLATQPATETLTYSTTNVTITAGKGPMQRSLLTVTNDFQLLWSGLTDNDGGVVHLIPATTNVNVLVSSPGRAAGSSAATATGSTTLTITGATNGWAELAWSVVSVGGTNRVSVNLGAY
jgi:hypothetical protein